MVDISFITVPKRSATGTPRSDYRYAGFFSETATPIGFGLVSVISKHQYGPGLLRLPAPPSIASGGHREGTTIAASDRKISGARYMKANSRQFGDMRSGSPLRVCEFQQLEAFAITLDLQEHMRSIISLGGTGVQRQKLRPRIDPALSRLDVRAADL
jgi:hypothetical protein